MVFCVETCLTCQRYMNLAGSELPLVSHIGLRRKLKEAGASVVDYGFTPNQSQQKKEQEVTE